MKEHFNIVTKMLYKCNDFVIIWTASHSLICIVKVYVFLCTKNYE